MRLNENAARSLALFLTGFGAFLNLYAPQPLLPHFRELFHASELQASLTVSAAVFAVTLTSPVVGVVADWLGRKGVICVAMLALAVTTALAATAETLTQLILWRFLQGICIPGIIAVAMAYISEESAPAVAGSIMARYIIGAVFGGFSGRFFTGLIAAAFGWPAGFLLLGVTTLLCTVVIALILPPARHFLPPGSRAASLRTLREHLRNPDLLATYAVGFSVLFSNTAIFTYVNFRLADPPFGLGPSALSAIFAVYLVGAAVTPLAGRLIDRAGTRRVLVGAVSISALGVLLTLMPVLSSVVVGLTLLATGVFGAQAAASLHVGEAARQARSSAAGLYVSVYYLGGTIGSIVPGIFWAQLGWPGCVACVVVMQLLTTAIATAGWRS